MFYTFHSDIGIFMIEIGYLSEFCGLGRPNISVGRGKAIKTLQQIAFDFCFMSRLITSQQAFTWYFFTWEQQQDSLIPVHWTSFSEIRGCSPCWTQDCLALSKVPYSTFYKPFLWINILFVFLLAWEGEV